MSVWSVATVKRLLLSAPGSCKAEVAVGANSRYHNKGVYGIRDGSKRDHYIGQYAPHEQLVVTNALLHWKLATLRQLWKLW